MAEENAGGTGRVHQRGPGLDLPAVAADAGPTVPSIHDITTDTQDPPRFVDVLPHRRGVNPPDYDGEAVAAQQRAAWPDLGPIDTPVGRARVHEIARPVRHSLGGGG